MLLTDKQTRDSYNIDTFERGIVWSALLLRQGYVTEEGGLKDRVKLGTNQRVTEGVLVGTVQSNVLFTVAGDVLTDGINLIDNLNIPDIATPAYTGVILPPSNTGLPVTTEPSNVVSLEQYHLWCCQQLLLSDLLQWYRLITIEVGYRGNSNAYGLTINANIAYNVNVALSSNSLLSAITYNPTTDPEPDPDPDPEPDPEVTGNDNRLDNNDQLTNEVDSGSTPQLSNDEPLTNDDQLTN